MTLTREQIASAELKLPTEVVNVPEWGGSVNVRMLRGDEADRFEHEIITCRDRRDGVGARALFALYTVCDDEGNRIFKSDDVKMLGEKSSKALGRILDVAKRLNGITEDEIEELEGN